MLDNAVDLPRWWLTDGSVELLTEGRLPYTLRWSFRVTGSNPPPGFSMEAWGDFEGRGVGC